MLALWALEGAAQGAQFIAPDSLRIQSEDTLSEALIKRYPHRYWNFWGPGGDIEKIAKLNPSVNNLNKLHPGDIIHLGEYASAETQRTKILARRKLAKEPVPPPTAPILEGEQASKPEPSTPEPVPSPETPATIPAASASGALSAEAHFFYSRIGATDLTNGSQATYLSNLNPGLRVFWRQFWSERLETFFALGMRKESFTLQSQTRSLGSSSLLLTELGAGARASPFENVKNLTLTGALHVRQEIFVRATSFTAVTLEGVAIPEISLGARYRVLERAPFSLDIHGVSSLLLSAQTSNYLIQTGTGYELGGTLRQILSPRLSLSGELFFSGQSQNTSIASHSRAAIGIALGLSWKLDAPIGGKTVP